MRTVLDSVETQRNGYVFGVAFRVHKELNVKSDQRRPKTLQIRYHMLWCGSQRSQTIQRPKSSVSCNRFEVFYKCPNACELFSFPVE